MGTFSHITGCPFSLGDSDTHVPTHTHTHAQKPVKWLFKVLLYQLRLESF